MVLQRRDWQQVEYWKVSPCMGQDRYAKSMCSTKETHGVAHEGSLVVELDQKVRGLFTLAQHPQIRNYKTYVDPQMTWIAF